MAYTDEEGALAVRIARDAVEAHAFRRQRRAFPVPARFHEKAGTFVTLNTHPEGHLRGCIGYPAPFVPLLKALVQAAEGACEDPRFPPLMPDEVGGIVVEVSLLTNPEAIEGMRPKDYPKAVRVGIDGLIAAQGPARGLLLPQVPVEWGWDAETFLSETCMKAGLMPDAWLEESTRISKFQSEVFSETAPHGAIVRRDLAAEHARH